MNAEQEVVEYVELGKKMKHKHNISQIWAHANACFVMCGCFYSHPQTTISMQVVFQLLN